MSVNLDEKPNVAVEPNPDAQTDEEEAVTPSPKQTEDEYPKGIKVLVIMSAAWLSMFLVALVCPSP